MKARTFTQCASRFLALFMVLSTASGLQSGTVIVPVENGLTATATFPDTVCVGQQFTVTYSVNTTLTIASGIAFWAGQVPTNSTAGQASFVSSVAGSLQPPQTPPFNTTYVPTEPPLGPGFGSGAWDFPARALPANTSATLTITYTATVAGAISFSTALNVNQSTPVNFTVTALNVPIIVNPKAVTVCPGATVMIDGISGNSGCGTLTLTSVTTPVNGGTAMVDPMNVIMYTAPATRPASGTDTFNYTNTDSAGHTGTAPVNVTIPPTGDPTCCVLTAIPKTATACPGQTITIDALAGNTACTGVLFLALISEPSVGTASCGTPGSTSCTVDTITYTAPATPPPSGVATFTYCIADETQKATGNITIKLTGSCCSQTVVDPFIEVFDQTFLGQTT